MLSLSPVATACNSSTGTYNVSGTMEFSNPPATGTLTLTDLTASPQVTQTFYPPFNSPQAYTLTNIPCDGLVHNIQGSFSDNSTCNLIKTYTAPPMVCPLATMSGGGEMCNTGTGSVPVQITFPAGTPPFNFTYAINGVPQTPVANYNGPFPYVINATTSGLYTLTTVSNTLCSGTVSGSANVIVHPLPVVNLDPFTPICIDTPPFTLTGGTPVGGYYKGKGVVGTDGYNPILNGVGTDTIKYTYTDIHGCINKDTSLLIVNPKPGLTITPSSLQICSGTTTALSLTSNVSGTTFTWTATGSSGNVTGFSGGTGAAIAQTLSNSGTSIETVTYLVTALANSCTSDVGHVVVTVYPVPIINPPAGPIVSCSGTLVTILLTSLVSNTDYTWTATASSPDISGFSDGSGHIISQTLINSGIIPGTVTYHATPFANGCNGNILDISVTVKPVPNLSNTPASQSQCNNQQTNITLQSAVSNTLFTWSASGSSGFITGYSDNATPAATLNHTLVNSGSAIETVTYHITPHANGCDGAVTDYAVTVYPTPTLNNTPASQSQCNNQATNITLQSAVANTLFTWSASGSSGFVTGYSDNSTPSATLNQTLPIRVLPLKR